MTKALADRKDKTARKWVSETAALHPDIPIRLEGNISEARFLLYLSSRPEVWPAGVVEAMAAGRAVVTAWVGEAPNAPVPSAAYGVVLLLDPFIDCPERIFV